MRWTEEVELLQEEMRRVHTYHSWRACWWEQHVGKIVHHRPGLAEGVDAYAHRQASIQRRMRDYCKNAWTYVGAWVCLGEGVSDMSVSDAQDDVPSMDTVTVSSVESLQAAMQQGFNMTDVVGADLALEDFD